LIYGQVHFQSAKLETRSDLEGGLRYSYEKAGGIIEDLDFDRGRYLSSSRGITRDRAAAMTPRI
jgi:hypothetical protein